MQTRKLGYTDVELTTVGIGTWALGGGGWEFGWGPQDDKQAVDGILAGLDEGINWIDTAAVYGLGHSEELVGKALKEASSSPFVATKCSLLWDSQRQISGCLKAQSVREECHNSLARLGVDVIDLYQVHWPRPDEDIEEGWEEMAKLVEQGKVRYLGVSNFDIEQMQRVQKIHPIASLQPPYSMIRRGVEDELLGFCSENDIGIVAYSPMQRGLLTGKFSHERIASLAQNDQRRRSPEFQDPDFSATLELVDKLKPIAERSGKTLAQLSIAWVLRRDEVTSAIVGVRRPDQVVETAIAGDWNLSAQDVEEIEKLLSEREQKLG
ncbi:MAG: aldo/keto reductase [Planctomycetota bacterium]|jgi:aryl-alcohol dehydrogenase-like predicted oxidoreductase